MLSTTCTKFYTTCSKLVRVLTVVHIVLKSSACTDFCTLRVRAQSQCMYWLYSTKCSKLMHVLTVVHNLLKVRHELAVLHNVYKVSACTGCCTQRAQS